MVIIDGIEIVKHGLTLALPWKGKSLYLQGTLKDVMGILARGEIGEHDAWKISMLLQNVEEHKAELREIRTIGEKIRVSLDFATEEQLKEFQHSLGKPATEN